MNTPTPEKPATSEREETLAERSARLESEAAGLYNKDEQDPLAPEAIAETDEERQDAPATASGVELVELKALQEELAATRDQAKRALAEAENTRRRAIKEREDASKFAVSGFAKDLLDVSDNLRRALEAVPTDLLESAPRLKNLVDGIEATERTLLRTFEKHGIEKIEPLDQPFDPNYHEVMFEAPVPGKPAGTVMQVMESGYVLNGRILRPARVGVVKDDGTTPPTGETPPGGHIDTQA
ncbi:MAG TPA: nucleotide exchange factor GrpE [Alphaproteobacteria bacterium]|nr:nucleotide exchange factor GrpE [Alphaproteobacteria bacterium]USO05892.1 MAG: nucleotide exchange factor GrpE [Rhodospirillales bacterium]HOO81035.1 nucleotide exchange factor GrpE [Alphaproteobacteria bacterium]